MTPNDARRPAPLVLIVDDHADTREMYSMYLTAQGMRVLVTGDGVTAVRLAEGQHPDVIVMDLALPLLDGLEAIRRLKGNRSTARIPIVACTGNVVGSSGESAIVAGCDAYVLKPCLPEHLLKEIRTLLDRSAGSGAHRQMSSRPQPERVRTLQLYPMQLRPGDHVTDDDGEWDVVDGPEGIHGGKTERVWVQRPGDSGTKREMTFPAYTKIAVRRTKK